MKLQQSLNYETIIATVRMDEPAKLSDTIAANLQLGIEEKQELLAIFDPAARLSRIADVLDIEIEKLDLDRNIQSRVKRQMERAQKRVLPQRKDQGDPEGARPRRKRASSTNCVRRSKPQGCRRMFWKKAIQELKKLEAMPPMSAESTVSRNYIDWLLAVPWKRNPKKRARLTTPRKCSTRITTGLEKNQGAHS